MQTILLSTRVTEESNYVERRSALAYDYVVFFEKLDYVVIPVPCNTRKVDSYFELNPTAIVLTGGNTVGNAQQSCQLPGEYPERDRVEIELLESAIDRRLPLLGICRGMQMINRFFGGTITHGIDGHVGADHLMSSKIEAFDQQATNSYHGDGVKITDVPEPLEIVAQSSDGWVEAIIHRQFPILGVQWHPERQDRDFDPEVILSFLKDGKCQTN